MSMLSHDIPFLALKSIFWGFCYHQSKSTMSPITSRSQKSLLSTAYPLFYYLFNLFQAPVASETIYIQVEKVQPESPTAQANPLLSASRDAQTKSH